MSTETRTCPYCGSEAIDHKPVVHGNANSGPYVARYKHRCPKHDWWDESDPGPYRIRDLERRLAEQGLTAKDLQFIISDLNAEIARLGAERDEIRGLLRALLDDSIPMSEWDRRVKMFAYGITEQDVVETMPGFDGPTPPQEEG